MAGFRLVAQLAHDLAWLGLEAVAGRSAHGQGRRYVDTHRRDRRTLRNRQVVYIEADDDTAFDAAADIIARALANIHPAVAGPVVGGQGEPAPVVRDLLDDIAAVLDVNQWGAEKVPAADIPARLRSLAPDWGALPVDQRDGDPALLDAEHGVKVATTGRGYPVDLGAIRDAITRRDATRNPDGPG